MNAAARSASENAARARRNAKAAGEVARRYGGGKKMKASGQQQEQENADNGSDNGLLEKTRERRSVARMAAVARHRRENPMMSASPSSPRRLGITPTSIVFETLFAAEDEDNDSRPVNMAAKDDNDESCNDIIQDHARVASSEGFEDAVEDHHDDYVAHTDSAEGEELLHTTTDDHNNMQQYLYYNQQQNYQEKQEDGMQSQQYPHSSELVHDQGGGGDDTELNHQFYDHGRHCHSTQIMQDEQRQSQPIAAAVAASVTKLPSPPNTHFQSTNASRIEDSHVEDVLSLSLELERTRSQLATTVQKLSDASSQVASLKIQNDHLREELTTLHSQLEVHNERSIAQLEQLKVEQYKSKAAEEDALEALELAKESQSSKEEIEMWLYQCLEDRDVWKGRCLKLEDRYNEEQSRLAQEVEMEGFVEPKKVVRFKQHVEDDLCATSGQRTISTPRPPPPDATATPANSASPSRSCSEGTPNNSIQLFTPTSSTITTTPPSLENDTPLSKSTAIATGRALLYRSTVAASSPSVSSPSTSPSPFKQQGLSPHPKMQAYDLLKKSAETRRLLRERLTPGRLWGQHHDVPLPKHINSSLSLNVDGFASRQGAACKAVGRVIRESGERLKLNGTWWSPSSRNDTAYEDKNVLDSRYDDIGERATTSTSVLTSYNTQRSGSSLETVAELETMVQEYCGKVETTIEQQQQKINELSAFCDHLENISMVGVGSSQEVR